MLLGHTKQINGVWKIQSLKQHSENVAEYCARACQPLGLENLGRLTGWLHDAGKSHGNVQKHLRGQTNEKINHSSAGMRWLWENYGGETASPPSRLLRKWQHWQSDPITLNVWMFSTWVE